MTVTRTIAPLLLVTVVMVVVFKVLGHFPLTVVV